MSEQPTASTSTPSKSTRTCDVCRRRKIKCLIPTDTPSQICTNCDRLNLKCTFDIISRPRGRPRAEAGTASKSRTISDTSKSSRPTKLVREPSQPDGSGAKAGDAGRHSFSGVEGDGAGVGVGVGRDGRDRSNGPRERERAWSYDHITKPNEPLPGAASSGWTDMIPTLALAASLSDGVTPPEGLAGVPMPRTSGSGIPNMGQPQMDFDLPTSIPISQAPIASSSRLLDNHQPSLTRHHSSHSHSHPHLPPTNLSTYSDPTAQSRSDPLRVALSAPTLQVEDVLSWSLCAQFLSLYLKYMHALFPLVHKPTFTADMVMRRDVRDRRFRSFVLGLVAYTIGQSPIRRLLKITQRPELERLQRDCHRASMHLMDRDYQNPSLDQLGTLITGYFSSASVGWTTNATMLVAEACQLATSMRLHDDSEETIGGMDCISVELRRRIFWHLYAVDATEAAAGYGLHFNNVPKLATLPLTVDDEYITTQGSFPQPPGKPSYATGFLNCVKMFPIMAEALERIRQLHRIRQPLTEAETAKEQDWIREARERMNELVEELPDVGGLTLSETDEAIFGMQRANSLVTALSTEYTLYDYEVQINPTGQQSIQSRETVGRDIYRTLSRIPLDDLAANGESMRGKVLRIILALMQDETQSEGWVETLQNWWNMYGMIQFVQLVPPGVPTALQSREGTPNI